MFSTAFAPPTIIPQPTRMVGSIPLSYATSTLPIRRVVIFKNGVAYFEREGIVENEQRVDLYFSPNEMNDVLRSLRVDGKISNIDYETTNASQGFLSFGFSGLNALNIPDVNSWNAILLYIRGSMVKIGLKEKTIEGRVIGLTQNKEKESNTNNPNIQNALFAGLPVGRNLDHSNTLVDLLVEGNCLFSVRVSEIESVKILNDEMTSSISEYLDNLLQQKKEDKRKVSFTCLGSGKRTVRVGYVIESPIWKSTYRININKRIDSGIDCKNNNNNCEKSKEKKQEYDFTLEGWGIVDNTSSNEWTDVNLTLVSGSSISFTFDLYNPILGIRNLEFDDSGKNVQNIQRVKPAGGFGAPQQNAFNVALNNNNNAIAHAQTRSANSAQQQQQQQQQQQPPQLQQLQLQQQQPHLYSSPFGTAHQYGYLSSTPSPFGVGVGTDQFGAIGSVPDTILPIHNTADTIEVANLFHYQIQNTISVPSNHSSLVPTISGNFKGRKVCWFSPRKHAGNPLQAIVLKNTLGTILDKGPLMIMEDSNYVGESLFDKTVLQKEEKLLAYGVHLEVKITYNANYNPQEWTETNISAKLDQHGLDVTKRSIKLSSYSVVNQSEDEVEMAVDHFTESGWPLLKTEAYLEQKYGAFTRLFFYVTPFGSHTFVIRQQAEIGDCSGSVETFNRENIIQYYKQGKVTSEAFSALLHIHNEAVEAHKLALNLKSLVKQEEGILADQTRIQNMISSLANNTGARFPQNNPDGSQKTFFAQKLADLENSLTDTRSSASTLFDEWEAKKDKVKTLLNKLSFKMDLEKVSIPTEKIDVNNNNNNNNNDEIFSSISIADLIKKVEGAKGFKNAQNRVKFSDSSSRPLLDNESPPPVSPQAPFSFGYNPYNPYNNPIAPSGIGSELVQGTGSFSRASFGSVFSPPQYFAEKQRHPILSLDGPLSKSAPNPNLKGTGDPVFHLTMELDPLGNVVYHSISQMPQYSHKSFEELRSEDYNKKKTT